MTTQPQNLPFSLPAPLFRVPYTLRGSTVLVALHKSTLFMQNKPNFWKSQMNVNKVLTRDYEKKTLGEHGKNKPNSNPIQTQTNPIQTQFAGRPPDVQIAVTSVKTRNYNNKQRTMNYELLCKTNPNYAKQTQSNPISKGACFTTAYSPHYRLVRMISLQPVARYCRLTLQLRLARVL